MKILHISSEPPGEKSGGQLVVKESVYSLTKLGQVDFIGPEILDKRIIKLINNKYYLEQSNNFIGKIVGIITLNFSSYYYSFIKKIKKIDLKKYDYIYIEFSKWLFSVNKSKRAKKKIIIRLHNIEKDYSYNIFKMNSNIKNYFKYLYYSYVEKKIVKRADYILVLTDNDKDRLVELYGEYIKGTNVVVMPVCIQKKSDIQHNIDKDNINILVTGSLWYGPNSEGIKWFLDNVWSEIRSKYTLYIVGSKPNKDLIKKASEDEKIILVKNPEDTKPYFEIADIYISPIFSGAGMKVKNAEAMSYGLPIVATKHSFIGYESSEKLHYIANEVEEFIGVLNDYKELNLKEINYKKEKIKEDFDEKYNIENSYQYICKILNEDESK